MDAVSEANLPFPVSEHQKRLDQFKEIEIEMIRAYNQRDDILFDHCFDKLRELLVPK